MPRVIRSRTVAASAALLALLPACSYYHPVSPPRADLAERTEDIRREVTVGSTVRVETVTGERVSGEVLSLGETLVLRTGRDGAEERRTFALANIESLDIKTWRKADTVFVSSLVAAFVVLAYFAVHVPTGFS